MITASFCIREQNAQFTVKGHSGSAQHGADIVCAAASSAAYLAANTVTEVLKAKAFADVKDGYMHFTVSGSSAAADIIRGLRLHFEQLACQYPDYVKVTTEV